MKKWIVLSVSIVLVLLSLAGCQSEPEVPYINGEGVQNGQLVPGNTKPQGGQQGTTGSTAGESDQPTRDDQQTTAPNSGQQGGQPSTQPTQPVTRPTQGQQGGQAQTDPTEFELPTPEACTYEQYMAMTGEQQQQFFNQFNGNFGAFFTWLDKAKAESEANSNDIVVDPDTTIDLEDIFGKQQ